MTSQAQFPDLPELDARTLQTRRERVLLVLAGLFLGAMAMLNILGITKFVELVPTLTFWGKEWGPLVIAVGVLPYPLTFLCTDFISEFYGRRCANFVVLVGLAVNLMVLGFVSLGASVPEISQPAGFQRIFVPQLAPFEAQNESGGSVRVDPRLPESATVESVLVPLRVEGQPLFESGQRRPILEVPEDRRVIFREEGLLERIATTTRMAVLASMIAYLAAQFIDVYLFHFWKRLTRGRHLWLRNNGSTLISQAVDTTAVVLITFWGDLASGDRSISDIVALIWGGYLFKMLVALVDTVPMYIGVRYLSRFLRIDPVRGSG